MTPKLENLKTILEKGYFDVESRKLLSDLENRYAQIVSRKNLIDKDGFREWLDLMKKEVEFVDFQLKEKEDLTEKQRIELFALKRVCRNFISLLTGDEEGFEKEVEQYLENARNV